MTTAKNTILSALESLPASPDPPMITLTGDQWTHELTEQALAALVRSQTEIVYQQSGLLVRLHFGDDGAPKVELLTPHALRGILDRVAEWYRVMKSGDVRTQVPMDVVHDILGRPSYAGLRRLVAVVEAPFIAPDGRLVTSSGYDAETGIYLHTSLEVQPVPKQPSAQDVRQAVQILKEPFCDFPFLTEASRANALGMVVTPLVRDHIDGPVPLFGVDGTMPGTGKGLLVETATIIATGRPAEIMALAADEQEIRRKITGVVMEGRPIGILDNLTRMLNSGAFAAVLTARTWKDRPTRQAGLVTLPMRTTFVTTGNNLKFSHELARRTVLIQLDAKTARPESRSGFRHPQLTQWVAAERGRLVWAILVLIRHWHIEGRPPFTSVTMGSFESWSGTVGGILGAAGVEGFLGNRDAITSALDGEQAAWLSFLKQWARQYGSKVVTTQDLSDIAGDSLGEILGEGTPHGRNTRPHGRNTRLGKALAGKARVVFDLGPVEVVIMEAEARDSQGRLRSGWRLGPNVPQRAEEGGAEGGGPNGI